MPWISDINDLQYYNQPVGVQCYCQPLLQPSDLYLQGVLDTNVASPSLIIYLADPDGTDVTANIVSYFDVYFATNVNGRQYFVARLKQFHPEMCSRICWILKVEVDKGFNYYTERYCAKDCCSVATEVSITTETFDNGSEGTTGGLVIVPPVDPPTEDRPFTPVTTGDCGIEYLLLETFSDCYNAFTGNMYQSPSNTISGVGYKYIDKILLKAFIRPMPANIERTYSLNCRLQRVQRYKQYQLQGNEAYPPAMMQSIQDYFTNQYIFLNGKRYELDTTEIFEPIIFTTDPNPMFSLNIILRECNIKQIFGCGDSCNTNAKAFIFGASVSGIGYYSENGIYIGDTCEDVANYFQSQQGILSVTILDPDDYDCDFECGVEVEALPNAYIPTSIYKGGNQPSNRVFGVSPDSLTICEQVAVLCDIPVIGDITNAANECDTPVIGDITSEEIPAEDVYIVGTTDWVEDAPDTTASRSQNAITFNLDLFNNDLTYDSGDPDAIIPFFSGQIGYIGTSAWPTTDKLITHPDFEALEATMIVQANGYIMYSGYVTSADLTGSTIAFTNLSYTLP